MSVGSLGLFQLLAQKPQTSNMFSTENCASRHPRLLIFLGTAPRLLLELLELRVVARLLRPLARPLLAVVRLLFSDLMDFKRPSSR